MARRPFTSSFETDEPTSTIPVPLCDIINDHVSHPGLGTEAASPEPPESHITKYPRTISHACYPMLPQEFKKLSSSPDSATRPQVLFARAKTMTRTRPEQDELGHIVLEARRGSKAVAASTQLSKVQLYDSPLTFLVDRIAR